MKKRPLFDENACLVPVRKLGVPKPGCLKTGCLNFYAEALSCTLLRPLCSFADLRLHSFACFCAICVFLRPTAFRTTAFGNCREKLKGAFSLQPPAKSCGFLRTSVLLKCFVFWEKERICENFCLGLDFPLQPPYVSVP